jgi:hypothetical protein
MSDEKPRRGMWAKFWSPNNTGSKPDVEGPIDEVRDDGRIVVNENGERVTINLHGGWLRYTFYTAVLVAAVSLALVNLQDYA